MSKKKRRRQVWLPLLLAAVLFPIHTEAADAQAPESRVLKVAFPALEGLSEVDQYGNYTGLVVDYLNEIAKYTGWEYEYIPVDDEDMVSNFLDGQYDLMGGTFYSPGFEEYFAYPEYNMGRSRAVLLCRPDDDSLHSYDLETLNGKTIGVYEKAEDKIRYLKEFLASVQLDCGIRYYTYEDMEESGNLYRQLRNGEVDMLMGNGLETGGEFRMVASFPAQPYYIVTTVGNTEVLEGLNMALRYIWESTPDFAEETYYRNFPDSRVTDIQLNEEELRYIEEKGTVTVAIPADWHPLYCMESPDEFHEGMLPELLEEISAFTGLEFEYVYGNDYAECVRMVQQGRADMLGAYLGGDGQAFSDGLALSKAYIGLNNMILKNKSVSYPGPGLVCGIMNGRRLPSEFEAAEVLRYDTIPELLEAVNTGKVDYIYGISSMLEQEMQKRRYLNVVPVTRVNDITETSFAVARPVTPELLTILNKGIGNIPMEEKTEMLNRNMVSAGYNRLSLQELVYANPFAFLLILSGVLLLIMTVILLALKNKMRNALMQSRLEAAEAKSRAKSGFLSRMSHEIRTPMNAIVGLADLACMEKDVPPEIEKKLINIRSSSKYLLALINDILDMSRIENDRLELEPQDFSLSVLLDEVHGMMEVAAKQKGLEFRKDCQISHDRLEGDPVRLRQILVNLLSNAIKFTPAGGSVRLLVNEKSCGGNCAEFYFSVKDTGAGIPREDQERIFLTFEQLKSSVSHSAGTGLGLPISRSVARLMGGELEVKSEEGKGAEFFMTLSFPLGKETRRKPGEPERSLEGVKVLLVEDNDLNAEIAQELLAVRGVTVCRAADGQEAVELFAAAGPGEFQAILMDIMMPVKDGYEAAREIRSSGRKDAGVPIIAMTANTFKEDEEKARKAGMNGFVPKPVDREYLFSVLCGLLSDTPPAESGARACP